MFFIKLNFTWSQGEEGEILAEAYIASQRLLSTSLARMMLPAKTDSPPNFLTPRRLHLSSVLGSALSFLCHGLIILPEMV